MVKLLANEVLIKDMPGVPNLIWLSTKGKISYKEPTTGIVQPDKFFGDWLNGPIVAARGYIEPGTFATISIKKLLNDDSITNFDKLLIFMYIAGMAKAAQAGEIKGLTGF